jgi:hypothetical protein
MEGSAKETVIIVHGTWAAPEAGKVRWYQPTDGAPAAEGFIPKLNAALQERASPARCWAHCAQSEQIFYWSRGENSWITRTHAASALGSYVAKLRNEGWRCHIVAHSHGGNVVIEALPQITAASGSNLPLGKIVTLGTPFIDTMSLIQKRGKRQTNVVKTISWILICLYAIFGIAALELYLSPLNKLMVPGILFLVILFVWRIRRRFGSEAQGSVGEEVGGAIQTQPTLLAIGSPTDEAWQILHHLRTVDNPLAVRSNLLRYLFSSLQSHFSRSAEVARIHGAKSFKDIGIVAKCVGALIVLFVIDAMIIILALPLLYLMGLKIEDVGLPEDAVLGAFVLAFGSLIWALLLMPFLGAAFYSAVWSPFRWCAQRVLSLASVGSAFGTYMVRRWSWPVLLKIAMGLEGYRFRPPPIMKYPSNVPEKFGKYEDMPTGAEQRALERRSIWVARHLADVSQTFSKMAVTAADISSLQQMVEEDQTLVHAAYYTEDECIARIADWIADK